MRYGKMAQSFWGAFLVTVTVLVAVTPPASASPTPTPGVAGKQVDRSAAPPTSGHQDAQEALWEDLQHYATDSKIRGLAGGSFESDGRTLTVYWAGETPTALTTIAQRHAATAVMSVVSVPYDKEEIAVRAKRLIAAAKQQGIPLGGVSSTRDFRGLRAKVDPAATATQRDALRGLGAAEVVNGGGKPVPLVRYADTPDFWGGAVIKRPTPFGDQVCSTGWAVKDPAGNKSMLTAQHCGPNQDWTTYQNNLFVGRSDSGFSGTDSMRLTGAGYSQFSYVGPWNSSSGRVNNDAADVALNTTMCASGALSGEVCNGRVDEVNAFDDSGVGPGFWASATQGLTGIAGQGDSGGPAYSYSATGRLILRGMVISSLPEFAAACPGGDSNPWNTGSPRRLCFTPVFFTNQGVIHAVHGVSPVLS